MIEIIDKNFENYLNTLFGKPIKNITQDDYNSISEINCMKFNIKNLQGIENFTNLEKLVCAFNFLKKLDISHNKKLKYLDLSHNKLSKIDISKNIYLVFLYCWGNRLSELDISKNKYLIDTVYDENIKITK